MVLEGIVQNGMVVLGKGASLPDGTRVKVVAEAIQSQTCERKRPLPKGMGRYHSGRSDVSVRARELLREAVEKGEWP